jgi:hypothetical protein
VPRSLLIVFEEELQQLFVIVRWLLLAVVGSDEIFNQISLPVANVHLSSRLSISVVLVNLAIFRCLVAPIGAGLLLWAGSRFNGVRAGLLTRLLGELATGTRQALRDELRHERMQVDRVQLADIVEVVLDIG